MGDPTPEFHGPNAEPAAPTPTGAATPGAVSSAGDGGEPKPSEAFEDPSGSPGIQLMVLMWCMWLLGSWTVVRWQEPPMRLERWMLLASMIGLLAAWPAIRLGQRRMPPGRLGTRPGGVALRLRRQWQLMDLAVEWLCLVLVFQAVVWPLSFVAQWSLGQALWVNAAVVAWSAAAAALIGWGSVFARGPGRGVAMLVCLVLLAGEPVLVALLTLVNTSWNGAWGVSPLPTLWALTEPSGRGAAVELARWYAVGMASAAGAGWLLLSLAAKWMPESADDGPEASPLRSTGRTNRS
ncbi:hypothetical protein ACERK3_03140 [Phycisphaerales bacterium AB-hyl4]|uniref:Uncharacterized protein n=1 Tax=Natronomicrosphaera hydrolytica TaxID=3242702 RepID=A0ABV4U115_9BACT